MRVFASALIVGILATAAPAAAQPEPSAADVAAARQLGVEGVKLANAGKCMEAIDRLGRAAKLFPAPTILGRLGECQVAVGHVVEGTENLQRVAREALPPSAPPAYVAARARAQKVLEAARAKIAKLTVSVKAPASAQVTVKIDGEEMSSALLGAARPTDPGKHSVEASAPGFLAATQTVTLAEGGSGSVALTLEPDPAAVSAASASQHAASPSEAAPAREAPAPSTGRSRTPAYVALGVGGAGVVAGSIFGVLALSKRSALDSACTNKVCPPSSQGDLDAGKTEGTISTIAFVIGGVGLAAGAALLFFPSPSASSAKAHVQPFIGAGSAGIRGSF